VREALHQWSTKSFRGAEGLTPRPAALPMDEALEGAFEDEEPAVRSPAARVSMSRRTGGRVSHSPALLSSAPTPPPRY